ncbi:MAG: TlpA family protein disulfide reductase [Planctomycetia bacterium]|nr:TlpA family protein disulfide reductase [Planctomycetia bacterium]
MSNKGKVVILELWATWCPPCRKEIPGFVNLYKKYNVTNLIRL